MGIATVGRTAVTGRAGELFEGAWVHGARVVDCCGRAGQATGIPRWERRCLGVVRGRAARVIGHIRRLTAGARRLRVGRRRAIGRMSRGIGRITVLVRRTRRQGRLWRALVGRHLDGAAAWPMLSVEVLDCQWCVPCILPLHIRDTARMIAMNIDECRGGIFASVLLERTKFPKIVCELLYRDIPG